MAKRSAIAGANSTKRNQLSEDGFTVVRVLLMDVVVEVGGGVLVVDVVDVLLEVIISAAG